jgi:AraC family transcriptional regulator, dual regulator of chb operon
MANRKRLISRYCAGNKCSLSYSQLEERWRYPRHAHKGHGELVVVTRGPVFQVINERRIPCAAGQILLIRERDVHELYGQGISFYNLMFTTAMLAQLEILCGYPGFRKFLLAPRMPPAVSLPRGEFEPLAKRLNKAFLTTDSIQRQLSLTAVFSQIVLDYFAPLSIHPRPADTRPGWLIRLLEQVEENPERPLSVASLVKMAGVSHEHLSRTFRKLLKVTPSGYAARQRLQWASRLLRGTDRKVLDICYQVGFGNLSYFCNLFRKEFNMTPREFRRRHRILETNLESTTVS